MNETEGNCGRIRKALSEQFKKRGRKYVMGNYFPTIGGYSALTEQAWFDVRLRMKAVKPAE